MFFLNRYFLCQIRNQRPQKHNNGWWEDRFAEKNDDHSSLYSILGGVAGGNDKFFDMICDTHCFLNGSGLTKHEYFIHSL